MNMNPQHGGIGHIATKEPEVAKPKVKVKNWMRNRPCPCKSGKKFKVCCMAKFK